mmetsp:Transcript_786/g.1353  ORF Transcript_786/g.1353 Transcript_786/m.1353 type:complete len:93 (-) Transcript_786:919-1197(-)
MWELSDRYEAMFRAALKFCARVWIDGKCMIQSRPAPIKDNMKITGRLYWHGNIVHDMILYDLSPEYLLRGWMKKNNQFYKFGLPHNSITTIA